MEFTQDCHDSYLPHHYWHHDEQGFPLPLEIYAIWATKVQFLAYNVLLIALHIEVSWISKPTAIYPMACNKVTDFLAAWMEQVLMGLSVHLKVLESMTSRQESLVL